MARNRPDVRAAARSLRLPSVQLSGKLSLKGCRRRRIKGHPRFPQVLQENSKRRCAEIRGGRRSPEGIENLRTICEEHPHKRYELEVIDIHQQPVLAKGEQLIAPPTLIKQLSLDLRPPPKRRTSPRDGR